MTYPPTHTINFKFLTWFERACMFRDDARKEMEELGISENIVFMITTSEAFKKRHSLVAIYQDFGRAGDEIKSALDMWVDSQYIKYRKICPYDPAVTRANPQGFL